MARKTSANKRTQSKRRSKAEVAADRRWSRRVMETSDALDLEPGVFKRDPRARG